MEIFRTISRKRVKLSNIIQHEDNLHFGDVLGFSTDRLLQVSHLRHDGRRIKFERGTVGDEEGMTPEQVEVQVTRRLQSIGDESEEFFNVDDWKRSADRFN